MQEAAGGLAVAPHIARLIVCPRVMHGTNG
jgi:hypothetical protein